MNKEQRITEAESNEAWKIFADREKYFALSDEQTVMVDAFVEAGQMKHASGEWPTLGEVHEKWNREAQEREAKRAKQHEDWAAREAAKKAV